MGFTVAADGRRLLTFGADGAAWKPNLAVLARTMAEIVGFPRLEARYDGPTLVIRGARSDYVADGFLPALRRLFPQVTPRTDYFRLIFRADDPRAGILRALAEVLAKEPIR